MFYNLLLKYKTNRRYRAFWLVVTLCSFAVSTTAYSLIQPTSGSRSVLASGDANYPWVSESSNKRERDHQQAAKFLAEVNFFEDGHGLVLPPSVTQERLKTTFGVEQLAEVSGLIHDDGKLYGLTEEKIGSVNVLVAGCAACHIGKAAGMVIPGLGNKSFDLFGLALATQQQIESVSKIDAAVNTGNKDWERAHQAGLKSFTNLVSHPEYDSGTAGAITQYFAAEMAFKQLGLKPFEKPAYAPAKAPILWGYGPKRKVGVFADGSLKGKPAGAAGVPLFIGNYSAEKFEKNIDAFEAAEQQFEKLLPPRYPFYADRSLADRGENIFNDQCLHCHGEHRRDQNDLPIYIEPQFIDLSEVGTDALRAKVYDDEMRKRVADSPLGDYIQPTDNRDGYIAPNLWGVWARFPYLHNGSVANLMDLLTTPEDRPNYIDMVEIGERHRFDSKRLGATPTDPSRVWTRVQNNDRWIFDTSRPGLGNGGHDFGTDLDLKDKLALIEYLKTL